jgi:predicted transposase YbfD/YdcC
MAEKIYCKEADYLLTVKGNQGGLEKSIRKTFDHAKKTDFKSMVFDEAETVDGGHGRVEKRKFYMLPSMYLFEQELKWRGLKSLIMIESERYDKSAGETTTENRYYISSLGVNAEKALRSIRAHWSAENNLHWCLDVGFREDECRSRIGDSAENFSMIRKIVLFLLKNEKTYSGIQSKLLKAAWSLDYILKGVVADKPCAGLGASNAALMNVFLAA